ncbi:MAG: dTDP-4-dehydrorhamnose 3,5-epimerase [Flavobacteriales bacterium]|nr:dTDP-4-dehydrorhamnose 3,5-epimerase [Flavobacteriales bacterium]MCB9166476.1 dTDP-4-dehydrorhamnose 3,5-epimerase [Flavobacteriales bacterium]
MTLQIDRFPIHGPMLVRPRIFRDDRGHFLETFNDRAFREATGLEIDFVQDNESISHKGVLRGLHFQLPPHAQDKLVRVARGAVLDVCVDIRPQSPTFGRHLTVELTERERNLLFVPAGFAHGFIALEPDTQFLYKCSAYYDPTAERTLLWSDPELGIDWKLTGPMVSDRDRAGATLFELFGRKP